MKCYCCDKILKPSESTRKFKESGTFTDMCDECLETINVETEEGRGVDEGDDENPFDSDDR